MRVFRVTWFALLIAGAGTAFAQAPDPDPQPDPDIPEQDPDVDVDVDVEPTPPPPQPQTQPPPQPYDEGDDTTVIVTPQQQQPIVEPVPMEEESMWSLDRLGIGLSAGGGVTGFTNDTLRDFTNEGGSWSVRATVGTRSPIAFEGAYVGSLQSIDALGLDDDALLTGNGVQGALRINATTDLEVQPFLYAGIGWRRYELANTDFNTSDVRESDNVLEIPVGIGVAYKVGGFMIDARGELRPAFYQDMIPSFEESDDAEMHQYNINANIGVEF